jgi:hypothetical protein
MAMLDIKEIEVGGKLFFVVSKLNIFFQEFNI